MVLSQSRSLACSTCIPALAFVAAATATVGKAARDALFLEQLGGVAIGVADVSSIGLGLLLYWLQARLSRWQPAHGPLVMLPLLMSCGTLLLAVCALAADVPPAPALIVTLYVWMNGQAVLALATVSIAAHLAAEDDEQAAGTAWRIGAAAGLGWTAGGLLTMALAARTEPLALVVIAGTASAVSPLLGWHLARSSAVSAVTTPLAGPGTQPRVVEREDDGRPVAPCVLSGRMRAAVCVTFLSAACGGLASLQLKTAADAAIGSAPALVGFFGAFYAVTGGAALVLHLLVTRLLLTRERAPIALVLGPLVLAAASVGFLATGTMAAMVLIKGSDHVFRGSFDRAATDWLLRDVPHQRMVRARTFIDAIVTRAGDACGTAFGVLWGVMIGFDPDGMATATIAWTAAAVAAAVLFAGGWRLQAWCRAIQKRMPNASRIVKPPVVPTPGPGYDAGLTGSRVGSMYWVGRPSASAGALGSGSTIVL